VNRITTKGLTDGGSSRSEISVSLNGSNFQNVISDTWPANVSDCNQVGDFDSTPLISTCSIPNEGGSININGLCTMLYDSDYTLGLDIVEADGSSYDFSSSTFANNLFPKAKTPSYEMQTFVKQGASTPETVGKKVCWTVSTSVAASVGESEDSFTVGVEAEVGVSYEDCSEWTAVPGGYNVYMSVFDQTDPNFDMAYSLVPEFEATLPKNKSVPKNNHPSSARVVCINRMTTLGLDYSEAGWMVENNINLAARSTRTNAYNPNDWPRSKDDCKFGFNSGSVKSCNIGYDGGSQSINNLCASLWDDSYELDVKITEVDTFSNDISSLTFKGSDLPKFSSDKVTRYTMKKFIKENANEKAVDHDGCVGFDLGIGLKMKVGAGEVAANFGVKYEDCSKWTEVPGGYNLHMSVYH